jgi:osmotically inducible protein OsmC
MIQKSGSAHWSGGLKDGKGTVSLQSGAMMSQPYSFAKRFEKEPGCNPEELIAAAHASCFAMAMSGQIENAGLKADAIDATSTASLDFIDGKPTVTRIHVLVTADVPGATPEKFAEITKATKEGCPISRLLAGSAEITMEAKLV